MRNHYCHCWRSLANLFSHFILLPPKYILVITLVETQNCVNILLKRKISAFQDRQATFIVHAEGQQTFPDNQSSEQAGGTKGPLLPWTVKRWVKCKTSALKIQKMMKQEPRRGGWRLKKFDFHLSSPHRSILTLESTCKPLVTLPSKSLSKREGKKLLYPK